MDKILVLGSDYGTIEIVKTLKNKGLYVIVADYRETTPTKAVADESWLVSTPDIDTLEKKCKEENVTAVITGASDFNIGNSRKLCKRLKLPFYCESDLAWEISTNKYEFKKLCKEVGAPIATDYTLSDKLSREELGKIIYPVVVKPVDKSGNKGMSYCSSEEELVNAYKYARDVSDNSHIIVERELHGPEFAVNYVIADGEPRLFFFSSEHNQPGELDNLYSIIITTQCHLKQYIEEVNDKVIEVFKKAGCTEGVAWVECIRDADSKFYLLEMGYRFGGEVVNIPYKDVSGFDSLNWMTDIALGKKHTENDLPEAKYDFKGVAATYLIFSEHAGTISSVEGLEEISNIPGVLVDFVRKPGDTVSNHVTMGVLRFSGRDCDDVCDIISQINSKLKVTDTEGNNIMIYFDNYQELKNEYNQGLSEM